ncbi:MAG: hypothetical protein FWH07_03450 [Oscillospiraceae bacterium]|nr:hypothetical protein [Oscillospiraceae bacterium]
MGRVLSQGEIDNLLTNLLEDSSVLPGFEPIVAENPEPDESAVPVGIAAFKAKIAAMQEAKKST